MEVDKVPKFVDRICKLCVAHRVFLLCFQVLTEAHRVLRPGGRFMCLEFSQVPNPVIRKLVIFVFTPQRLSFQQCLCSVYCVIVIFCSSRQATMAVY